MRIRYIAVSTLVWSLSLFGCGGAEEDASPSLKLEISSPTDTVHTNGRLTIQVVVTEGAPERVSLEKDGELLVNLVPPYQYAWDTTAEPEGTYELRARAIVGEVSAESSTRTVVVDRTAPTIVARFPEPGSSYACNDATAHLVLSEPIHDPDGLEASIRWTGPQGDIPKSLSWSEGGTRLSIIPALSLRRGDSSSVLLPTNLRDLAGNPLTLPAGEWSWESSPTYCSITGGEPVNTLEKRRRPDSASAFLTDLIVDHDHNPVVAWTQLNLCKTYLRRWGDGGFGEHELVSDACTKPRLQFAGSDLYVAQQSSFKDVYLLQKTADGWAPLGGALNVDTTVHGHAPSVAIDAEGRPFVAWWERSAGYPVHVKRWSGSTWESLQSSVPGVMGETSGGPSLVLTEDGAPLIAISGPDVLLSARTWDGSDWVAFGSTRTGTHPQLRVSRTGRPFMVYRMHNGFIHALRWDEGWSSLASPGNIIGLGSENQPPAMVLDQLERPVVAFTSDHPEAGTAVYVTRWNGTLWEDVEGPFAVNPLAARSRPSIALDANDRPIVSLVEETSPGVGDVFVWRFND